MGYSLLRTCTACGARNRVTASRLADDGRCGSCKAALPPQSAPVEVDSSSSFDEIVQQSKVPVLVDFWAAWCGPCRMAAPEVGAVAQEAAGRAVVLKVDTERNPDLASRYRVQSIPNFIVFQNGKPVMQRAGMAPKEEMRRWIEAAASSTVSR